MSGPFKLSFALSAEQMLKLGAQFYDNDFFANSYYQTSIATPIRSATPTGPTPTR